MRTATMVFAISAFALAHSASAEEKTHRELGAHVHGQGTLSIAIEGQKVQMELVAPGDDIVGFEHPPKTDAQKAALAKAKATLSNGLTLFKLPQSAGCKLVTANAETRPETHHDDEDEKKDAKEEAGEHSEFHAVYEISCAAPEKLTALETVYFTDFKKAQALNVSIVSTKGQSQMQMTRDKPIVDLAGLM